MSQESLQIALIKYNKKTWCKSGLLGFFIGLAVIVPGISGSTVAIIFRLYDQFLYALGNLFKQFKKCFAFLLPIVIGTLLGVGLGFFAVKKLIEVLPFSIVCLFAGLMVGAFPAVFSEIKHAEKTTKRILLFAVGLSIPVVIGCLSAFVFAEEQSVDIFAKLKIWHPFAALLIGAVCGITQIVPGLSASAILMSVGWFHALIQSVSVTYWQSNPAVFLVYIGLAVGFIGSILLLSKLLSRIFTTARTTAYCLIVGLALGSIFAMFCNGDMLAVYTSWAQNGVVLYDLILGVIFFAVGIIAAYALVKYQRKKDAENAQSAQTAQGE